jgi:hypothetical protein
MLIGIGRRVEPAPDDVVGPLLSCHERIRQFSVMAERLASGRHPPGEVADAAARVERYFRVALPLHVEDEERSLRPRLLALSDPRLAEALDAMTAEHAAIDALLASLVPRWAELSREPDRLAVFGDLARDSAELRRVFDAHLAAEERLVFPVVADRLAAEALGIRDEIRARRVGVAGARA